MTYKLLSTGVCVVSDRTPILTDIKDGCELSFLLPDEKPYVAMLIDKLGAKYRVKVVDGKAALPREVMFPQYLQVYLLKLSADGVERAIACEPLKVARLADMLTTQFEVSGGLTEPDLRQTVQDLQAELSNIKERLNALTLKGPQEEIL